MLNKIYLIIVTAITTALLFSLVPRATAEPCQADGWDGRDGTVLDNYCIIQFEDGSIRTYNKK